MLKKLFLSVCEISISTSLIIFVLLVFSSVLNKRYAAKWKYYIWIALAFRLVIPVNINLSLRQIVINIPAKITSPVDTKSETGIPIMLQMEQKFTEITLLDFISVIWLVVCLCFLFVHISVLFHYKTKIIREGTYVKNRHTLKLLFKLQKDLQIKTKVAIIKYSGASSPMIIGFVRPLLVLPDHEYSRQELFFILQHELIHLKHNDIYFKLLFVTANAVHWFNPLVYIMRKEADLDMELSCDERVIQGADYAVRKAYTNTLLSTLHKQYKKATLLTTQFYGGKQIMKKRFKNILLKTKKKNGFPILLCATSITLVLGMMTGCTIQKSVSKVQADSDSLSRGSWDNIPSDEKHVEHANVQTAPKQTQKPSDSDDTKNPEKALSDDGQEIKRITEKFTAAYFSGDIDTVESYLTDSYEWNIEAYTGTGTIGRVTIKGLSDVGKEKLGSEQVISVEYKDSTIDSLRYLTLEFVKLENGWRIKSYGIEG